MKEREPNKQRKKELKRKEDEDQMVAELLGLPGSLNIMRKEEEQRKERKISERRSSMINSKGDFSFKRGVTLATPKFEREGHIKLVKKNYDAKEKLMPYYGKSRPESNYPRIKA